MLTRSMTTHPPHALTASLPPSGEISSLRNSVTPRQPLTNQAAISTAAATAHTSAFHARVPT